MALSLVSPAQDALVPAARVVSAVVPAGLARCAQGLRGQPRVGLGVSRTVRARAGRKECGEGGFMAIVSGIHNTGC